MQQTGRTAALITRSIGFAMNGQKVGYCAGTYAKAKDGFNQAVRLLSLDAHLSDAVIVILNRMEIRFAGGGSIRFFSAPDKLRGLEFHYVGLDQDLEATPEERALVKSRERLE